MNIIDYIGLTGPVILFIYSIFLLINKPIFLYFYVGGTIINNIINIVLKFLFKEARPNENKELFALALKNGKDVDIHRYGMPSGHMQNIGFSCIFIYLVLDNIYILWFYLLVSILTMFQRYKYNMHTIFQTIIGFMVGLYIGYLFFIVAKKKTKGKICSKKDDFCFL